MIPLVGRPDRLGFSVRVDWPDGSHDVFGWRRNWYAAWRLARRARAYWQAGPTRPHTWAILTLTRRQVRAHACACRDRSCPRGSITFPMTTPRPSTTGSTNRDQLPETFMIARPPTRGRTSADHGS